MFNSLHQTLAAQAFRTSEEKVSSANIQLAMGKSALEKGELGQALHLFNLAALPRQVDSQLPTSEQSQVEAEYLIEVVKNKIAALEIQKSTNTRPQPYPSCYEFNRNSSLIS